MKKIISLLIIFSLFCFLDVDAATNVNVGESSTLFNNSSCKITECNSSNSNLEIELDTNQNVCKGKGITVGEATVTIKCEGGQQQNIDVKVVEKTANSGEANTSNDDLYKNVKDKQIECSSFADLMKDINGIFDVVKILIPVIIVVMSTYDFIRAIAGKVEGDTKKAFQKFVKRLVFAIILFFLPSLLNFFLGLIDPSYSTCVNIGN